MFRSDLKKKWVCSICYKNALSEPVFGKWIHLEISLSLWELQGIRDWLCLRDIAETSLNRLLLFLTLKSSHRSYSVQKNVLKNFTGKHFCWSLFFKKLQAQHRYFHWNLQNFLEHLFLKTTVSLCKSLFTVHQKETANET